MNKFVKYILSMFISVVLFSMSACSSEPDIETGMWSWSMSMEMSGIKMPPVTYDSCVTKEELIPQQSNLSSECKMLENRVENNTILWTVECNSAGVKSTSKGEITYAGSTANGEIEISTKGMIMKSKVSGHKTGACK